MRKPHVMVPTLSALLASIRLLSSDSCCATASAGEAPHQQQTARGPAPEQSTRDDLRWLVGRWRCVTRQYFSDREKIMAGGGDSLLEYFNVYFPFADDRLTLDLTGNPDDRQIAAEFIVRHVYELGEFREQSGPMFEGGPVRVGKGSIWYGYPVSDDFKFKYSREERGGRLWLVLESRAMRFELMKLLAPVGNIRNSFATAPIKNYSAEQIRELETRYEGLTHELGR